MVVGPTGCGKTEHVFKILLSYWVFLPVPTRIKYYYGAWQTRFAEVEAADPRFEFAEGLPVYEDLPEGSEHTVMAINDLMEEASKSKTAMDIFTKHSHHRNMTVYFWVKRCMVEHTTRESSHKMHTL